MQLFCLKGTFIWCLLPISLSVLSACSNSERAQNSNSALQDSASVAASVPTRAPVNSKESTQVIDRIVYHLSPKMEVRAGVKTETIAKHSMAKVTIFSSSVEPTSDGSAVVNSLVRGVVTKVLADIGQSVKANQILCYVNCPELAEAQSSYLSEQAKVLEAKAQVAAASSRISTIKSDWERQQTLNKEGISSVKQVQSAQNALSTTQAELAAAKAMLAATQAAAASSASRLKAFGISVANLNPQNLTSELAVRSPISGIVTQRNIKAGENVNPNGTGVLNAQEGLFHIVNLDQVWVMLEVPQSEVSELKVGAPVNFETEVAPGKLFQGRVVKGGENFDPQSRTVSVRVVVNNPSGVLKPGMLVLAKAEEGTSSTPIVAVDNEAIQDINGKAYVFVQTSPNTYKKQEIQKGAKNSRYTAVLQGLSVGQRVVTKGSFTLKSEVLKGELLPDE
ncbi:MAG: efflux RND transporter periplasmic adaptor subunit [Candidatus Obscuribacterales bacterium]|nr:efflux RND transporter periplasmic adaptor subunit [Candidatus Obscuribacterales bacterium]